MGIDVHEKRRNNGEADYHPAIIATWAARDRARKTSVKSAKITAWRKKKAREKAYSRRYLGDKS